MYNDDSERVEQVFRIEALKGEIEEAVHGQCVISDASEDCAPEVAEQFFKHVLDFEHAEMVRHRELLARHSVALPPEDELSDEELALKLIEVIHTLAKLRTYLYATNHLSDRELYRRLVEETLEGLTYDFASDDPANCHIDLSNGCDEDIYLRYYADEDTREHWLHEFPDTVMPPHEEPPYDRDRHLPVPPEPYNDPVFIARCWADSREEITEKLATDGIIHAPLSNEPFSYATGLACVWAITCPDNPDTVIGWGISGWLPTTYLPISEAPDARAFLHIISQRWLASIDKMEREGPANELRVGAPHNWPFSFSKQREQARVLEEWAEDDAAWEEE